MQLEIISKYPSGDAHPTPLLFVHGAWHGAWCWDVHFLDYFAQRGYAAHAVSLRGHGNSAGRDDLRWMRIADYAEDVAQAVSQLPSHPILLGHSMGGHVVQKYLESHPAPGAVLMASVPPAGALAATIRIATRHPLAFAKVNLTFSLLPLVSTPALARDAFFSDDMPDDLVRAYARRLQDESYLGFLDMVAFNLPKPGKVNTPMLVLGGECDKVFAPHEIEATARAYNVQREIFAGVAHDMMLSPRWQAVAGRILICLEKWASQSLPPRR